MRSKLFALIAVVGMLALIGLAAPGIATAASEFKDVFVRNSDSEPVPTRAVTTTTVEGTVTVAGTPSVAISGTPTVAVAGTPAVTIDGTPTVNVGNTGAAPVAVRAASRPWQEWVAAGQFRSCFDSVPLNGSDEGDPVLVRRLYLDAFNVTEPIPVAIEATMVRAILDGGTRQVQTLKIGAAELINGAAVYDFGDTGIYVDQDRNAAGVGDIVDLWISYCDTDHPAFSWQVLAVGFLP